ncbi:MAG: GNAT family N-acetyltransferase [Promethearchaeota archaeon]
MVKVRDFTPADAAGLAKCINESEGGWPGGITGGVDQTAEHVLDDYEKEVNITWLIAITEDKQVAGVSTLHPHFDDPKAAYLGFLNVGDSQRKKGFGKALLVESVNRVTAEGYKRLYLHTWGGNLNAVPVYKRTGFFWRPDTQVLMENYIPSILKLPIAQPFFRHNNWYDTYNRQIELKPDEMKHRGLNVYEYRWEKANDFLRVVIDRESRGPTLIENNELLVECWVEEAEPPLGLPIPIAWMIENKNQENPLKGTLTVKLPKGFKLIKAPVSEIIVPPKSSITLKAMIQGQVTIVPPPDDKPALTVTSRIRLGDTRVHLQTGIRSKHPIQVSTVPPSIWCRPGNKVPITIAMRSNLKDAAQGVVFIQAPKELHLSQYEFNITFDPEHYAGIEMDATTDSTLGTHAIPLTLYSELQVKGHSLKTRTETIYVHCLDQGGVLVTPYNDNQRLQVQTETLHFSINLAKGAHIDQLANRLTGRVHIRSHARESLGPPFWPSEQIRTHFKHRIKQSKDGTTRIRTWMTSKRYPGLVFSKTFLVTGTSSVVGIEYGFENTDPKRTHNVKLQMGSFVGVWDHLHVLPLKDGLLREEFIEDEFFASDRELPKQREEWAETWYCQELPHKGEVVAVLVPPSLVSEAEGFAFIDFQLQVPPLAPKTKTALPPIYLVSGMGSWRHIRRLWHYYYSEDPEKALQTELEPYRAIDIRTQDYPMLLEAGSELSIPLQVRHLVHRPLTGSLRFSSPKGWQITPKRMKFKNLKRENPLSLSVQLRTSERTLAEPQVLLITAHVDTKLQTHTFEVPIILHRKSGTVTITQETECGHQIYIVDNGKFILKVAPGFAGSVFAWINKETGTNYLESNFPKAGPRVWFNPWYGGIRFDPFTADQPGWVQTKLDRETWTINKSYRHDWQGITLSVLPDKEEKKLRDLELQLQILTQPHSNLVACIGQIINQSRAPRQIKHRYQIAIPSNETTPRLRTVTPRATTVYRRNRVRTHAWPTTMKPYLGLEKGPDEATLMFVQKLNPTTELFLADLNPEIVLFQTQEQIDVGPKETVERIGFLVATQLPWEQAKAYAALSKIQI